MKRLLIIIILLLSTQFAFGQIKPIQTLRGNWLIDSSLMFTGRDTSFQPTFPALLYKSSDKSFYKWDLSKWSRLGGLNSANNGLNINGDNIQLGGNLIKNTSIYGNNQYALHLNPSFLRIGSASASTSAKVIINLDTTGSTPNAALVSYYQSEDPNLSKTFGYNGLEGVSSILLSHAPSGVSAYTFLSGIMGKFNIPQSSGAFKINSQLSPASGVSSVLQSANGNTSITDFAWFSGGFSELVPTMPTYTGTIDTAYGLYLENIKSGQMGADISRAYGIYVKGQQVYNYLAGHTGFGINTATAAVDINGTSSDDGSELLRVRKSFTPTSSSDAAGQVGSWAWDDNYFYVKTSSGWKRAALTTF